MTRPLPARQRGDRLADRPDRRHRQSGQRLRRRGLHRLLVEQEVPGLLPPEEHVLHDVEVVGEGEVLVHGLDAELGRVAGGVEALRLPLPEDLAGIRGVDARDDANHHRLSRPVVTDERGDTGGDDDVDVVQRVDGAESLVDPS
jgi:hypothetical protein